MAAAFVPVTVAPMPVVSESPQHLELELQRGPVNPTVRWSMVDALHQWMRLRRQKIPDGSAIARTIDYSLNR